MKTSVYIGTSLDGFIARMNGDISWLTKYEEDMREDYAAFIKNMDVVVIGRRTFETVLSYPSWPYSNPVFVLSSSIKEPPKKIGDRVTILCEEPGTLVRLLSDKGFKNAYIDGGKTIQRFLDAD